MSLATIIRPLLGSFLQFIVWLVVFGVYALTFPKRDYVAFLDVGQGDSALISIGGTQILVDGGPDDTVTSKLGQYMPPWDMDIEYVVITHPHMDHLSGVCYVSDRYGVGEYILGSSGEDSYLEGCLGGIVDGERFPDVAGGRALSLLDVLWPVYPSKVSEVDEDDYGMLGDNLNNDSVVFQLDVNGRSFLFMGDAEKEVEEALLRLGSLEDVDVLKAGHHCSDTSSTKSFIEKVNPEIVICSYGEGNSYGHPSVEVVDRFEELGIRRLDTALEGDIVIYLD